MPRRSVYCVITLKNVNSLRWREDRRRKLSLTFKLTVCPLCMRLVGSLRMPNRKSTIKSGLKLIEPFLSGGCIFYALSGSIQNVVEAATPNQRHKRAVNHRLESGKRKE